MIEMDKGGALRDQIEIFRKLFEDQRFAEPLFDQIADTIEAGKPLINQPLWTLVATMMVVAGLVKNAGLVATKKIRAEDLERFKRLLTDNRVMIEETIKSPLRADYLKNPVRQLNVFLGFAGLKLVATKRKQQAGQANIEYKLDPNTVKVMISFL